MRTLPLAALATAAQIALALIVAPPAVPKLDYLRIPRPMGWVSPQEKAFSPLLVRYLRLNNWDSLHYWAIAERGYPRAPEPLRLEDVQNYRAPYAFFPAYPLAARVFRDLTGTPTDLALLLTSQGFCLLFWVLFVALLRALPLSTAARTIAIIAVLVHPGAFYAVAGYSESLFLATLLGALLGTRWLLSNDSRAPRPLRALAAGASGALLTSCRLVGAPLALLPATHAWFAANVPRSARRRDLAWAALATALSFCGIFGYFWLLRERSGHWDLYFRTQSIGWANVARYLAFLDPRSYLPRYFLEDTLVSIHRTATLFSAALLAWTLRLELLSRGDWRRRAALYEAALVLLYLSIAGKAGADMDGMARYTFPVFVVNVLLLADLHAERAPALESGLRRARASVPLRAALAAGFLLALGAQLWLEYRFLRGKWVS